MNKQEKTAVVAIICNIVLTVLKFVLAGITLSVALLAEAYHSFSDILSSCVVFWATRSDRLYGRSHQAGKDVDRSPDSETQLQKDEQGEPRTKRVRRLLRPGSWQNRVAIGIGIFLIVISINILTKVRGEETLEVRRPIFAAVFLTFLALLSYLLSKLELHVGNKTNSAALIADGHHARVDMLASALVVMTMLGEAFGWPLDQAGAVVISLLIFVNGVQVLWKAGKSYVRSRKSPEEETEISPVFEDVVFRAVTTALSKIKAVLWSWLKRIPGFHGEDDWVRRRLKRVLSFSIVSFAVIVYALSGFYTLLPSEKGIVERFGRPVSVASPVEPGLHYHLPLPFERVRKADVAQIRLLKIGYQVRRQQPDLILWTNVHYSEESSLLTGEYNFLDFAMNIHYRVRDLASFLYNVASPESVLKSIAQRLLRDEIGRRTFFDSITRERDELEVILERELQSSSDQFGLGFEIVNVCLLDLHPPVDVALSFEDVVSAQEDYETFIEEARGYFKDLVPRTRGQAHKEIAQANSDSIIKVETSSGRSAAFCQRLEAYQIDAPITRKRLYLETMEEVLANVPKFIIPPGLGTTVPRTWFWLGESQREYPEKFAAEPFPGIEEPAPVRQRKMTEEDLIEEMRQIREDQP